MKPWWFCTLFVLFALLSAFAFGEPKFESCVPPLTEQAYVPDVLVENNIRVSPWNPSARTDNCVAGVSAYLRYRLTRGENFRTADDVEAQFAYAGRERKLDLGKALEYIQKATGFKASPKAYGFNHPQNPPGYYAVFAGKDGIYEHVLIGVVKSDGSRYLYDPQIGARPTWSELAKKYGGGRAYLFTGIQL